MDKHGVWRRRWVALSPPLLNYVNGPFECGLKRPPRKGTGAKKTIWLSAVTHVIVQPEGYIFQVLTYSRAYQWRPVKNRGTGARLTYRGKSTRKQELKRWVRHLYAARNGAGVPLDLDDERGGNDIKAGSCIGVIAMPRVSSRGSASGWAAAHEDWGQVGNRVCRVVSIPQRNTRTHTRAQTDERRQAYRDREKEK